MEANGPSAAVTVEEEGKKMVRLRCSVKTYDWGRVGRESSVARLYERNSRAEEVVEEGKPYAEFWMGTHESGPSYVAETTPSTAAAAANGGGVGKELLTLKDLIEKNPKSLLGDKVFHQWGPNLPFLFKVVLIFFLTPFFYCIS